MPKAIKRPVCSIIIPTRDCRDYLVAALASIRDQKVDDLETIIVDDGSTDGTREYLEGLCQKDGSIVVLKSDGIGPGRARNLAMESAKSDLIAFLDADDIWRPGKLAAQLAFHHENPDVVLSFTNYLHVDPEGNSHGTAFEFWQGVFASPSNGGYACLANPEAAILSVNIVGTSTVVARLQALQIAKSFATSLRSATDWDMWLKLAGQGAVACSSEVMMDYLMRPGSITRNRGARISAMEAILARYVERAEPEVRAACRIARANIDVAKAEKAREDGEAWGAFMAHGRAFVARPNRRVARAAAADLVNGARGILQSKGATR